MKIISNLISYITLFKNFSFDKTETVDKNVPVDENGAFSVSKGSYKNYTSSIFQDLFDGDKFPGSFGITRDYRFVDYWTLRKRSMQLFKSNPYAKGIIKRLLRNEINTGLNLESSPIEERIGISEEVALQWANDREIDWQIWAENPELCDWKKKRTLTDLAEEARQTALISGDVLIVLRINSKTGLPAIDIIDGQFIQSPTEAPKSGNKIEHGVEIDKQGRHIAFWVINKELKPKRIPARGEKSGRKLAWLIIGSKGTLDEIRGEPILANMLYMLNELDKYRDSEQRAAVVNSMIAMFVEKTQQVIGSRPIDGGAVRKSEVDVSQQDGSVKKWNMGGMLPGTVPQELAFGEKIVSPATNRPNVNFGKFEETIINTFAWSLEVPPEIVRLLFQNNFSASRQANNEFDVYLKYRFKKYGTDFYQNIYKEWLVQQVLLGEIQTTGLLESWRDPKRWREFGAWINAEWTGLSRPSVDFKKDVDANAKALDYGFKTQDQICRELANMPFKVVLAKRKREIEAMEKAGISFASEENQNREPIQKTGTEQQNINAKISDIETMVDELHEKVDNYELSIKEEVMQ